MRHLLIALLVLGSAGCERTTKPQADPSGTTAAPAVTPVTPGTPASTTASTTSAPAPAVPMPAPAEVKPLAAGSNAFAFDLYGRTAKTPGNQVFSPASISIALAMTWAGAKGETAAQIQKVMHFEPGATAAWGRYAQAMSAPGRAVKLRSANRLFGEKTARFEQPFLDATRASFGAPLEQVDFKVGFEPARRHINAWVEQETEQRIKELLPKDALDELTRLVLVNAIYFLADWLLPFEKERTFDADFEGLTTKKVPTMHRAARFAIAQVDGVKVLEMPYVGGDTSMLIVLPDAKNGLAAVEKTLGAGKLEAWTRALSPTMVDVALPRFELSPPTLALRDELSAMGMPLAFDRKRADFTLIANPPDPAEQLYIQKVFHKAFVRVDEKGTEAAAATAVVMARGGSAPMKSIEMKVDHPFLFFIRDRATGLILFMGRVADPSKT